MLLEQSREGVGEGRETDVRSNPEELSPGHREALLRASLRGSLLDELEVVVGEVELRLERIGSAERLQRVGDASIEEPAHRLWRVVNVNRSELA